MLTATGLLTRTAIAGTYGALLFLLADAFGMFSFVRLFGLASAEGRKRLLSRTLAVRLAQTYRAAICHEIAHAVLGHLNAITIEGQQPDIDDRQRLLNARKREIEADVFGMRLHLESLPHPAMMETAAATLIYNVHATSLLRFRLMVLAEVVDTDRWTARVRHPDPLARFGSLVATAESRYGADVAGLMTATHADLEAIGGELRACQVDQRDSVRNELLDLAHSTPDQAAGLGPQLDRLLSRSPADVIRALDLLAADGDSPVVAAQLVEAMPRPVQRFVALPFDDRIRRVLNRVG